MATAVVADHGLDADERAYLNLGLETTEHLRQPYQATQSYRGAQETGAPYVVRGFPSTSGSLGGGGSGGYAVGSAPVSSYGGAGGGAGGSMYGGIAGGTSVHVTPQQTPQLAPQPLARRSLTHPDTGISNDGWDNENSDLILAVGDVLVNMAGDRYVVQCMLGQGTFGQVVECIREDHGHERLAVKVIKNQQAYFQQARVEVGILQMLNSKADPGNKHHIVRMCDFFVHRLHLCLVFELLAVNLYELIKRNQFRGLSIGLLRVFITQILDALAVLRDEGVIHCDLKPENVLLEPDSSGNIKVIDFGSACMQHETVYTYIQSRFYRSPEVLLGYPYNVAIDMWSLGCVAAELFLGLPLFPGASEHDLLTRVVEMMGPPPDSLLATAKHTKKFFHRLDVNEVSAAGHRLRTTFQLLSKDEFEARTNTKAPAGKRYFQHRRLADIVGAYPLPEGCTEADAQLERQDREAFVDFLLGVLDMDPATRWTPRQALQHPFINTGVQFTGPFQPPPDQHLPGFKAMQRQQEDAYRMTGSLAGVLPSPGATALLATSPQAHEQAHAVAVAAMAQLSPQLGSQLLQHRYSAHGAGGHSLPAPRLGMPGTSPPQTIAGGYGGAASAASFGGGATWGQSRHSGGGARYGSPQPLMQQSATGGGGERSMFSPPEPAVSGLQHSSGSAAQAAAIRHYLQQQAALDQQLEQQRQQQLASDAAALSSAFAASAVGSLGAGGVPVGSMARSLPGLRGQQTHYGSYTTGATALSTLQQQAYLSQMLALQQQQAPAESASYHSPQHMLRAVGSGGGGASYAASASSYDPYQSPQRSARHSGGAAGSVQASPYSMLSPAAAASRQYSYAGGAGGYAGGSSGVYRRSSYSSQIQGVPEDEPLSNFDTAAGLSGGPVPISRRTSGRSGGDAASMPDPGEWDPLYSDDLLLAGDAAARYYADSQSAASQRRLQHQQHQQQQQATEMYLDTLQQQQRQQLQDQQQASMVQAAASRAVYLQPDGSHVVGTDTATAPYQREGEQYGGLLPPQAPYAAASDVAAGFGGEVLSDGLGDLRQGPAGALLSQGVGQYDSDQVMRIASQDLPGYSGRWPGDDGADATHYHLAAGGSGQTLSEIDWYDPRLTEQQLLAQRQQQHQQMLAAGYDCGESAGEQGADADALPHQTSNWIPG